MYYLCKLSDPPKIPFNSRRIKSEDIQRAYEIIMTICLCGRPREHKKKKRHLPLGHGKSILVMCLGRNVEDTLTLVKFISIFSPWLSIQLPLLFLVLSLLKSCYPFFQLCYFYSKPAPFFCTPVYA